MLAVLAKEVPPPINGQKHLPMGDADQKMGRLGFTVAAVQSTP